MKPASDSHCRRRGDASYHKVTVKVTNVAEPGKVTLDRRPADGAENVTLAVRIVNGGDPIVQFQVERHNPDRRARSDGDITNEGEAFKADVPDEVTGVTWRWYRGRDPHHRRRRARQYLHGDWRRLWTSRIRVVATYLVDGQRTRQDTASLTSDYPVLANPDSGATKLEFDPATIPPGTMSEGDKDRA